MAQSTDIVVVFYKICPSKNKDSPAGRPDVLYFIPEADDRASYLNEVPEEEVEVAMDLL